jgi:hypothetical protein
MAKKSCVEPQPGLDRTHQYEERENPDRTGHLLLRMGEEMARNWARDAIMQEDRWAAVQQYLNQQGVPSWQDPLYHAYFWQEYDIQDEVEPIGTRRQHERALLDKYLGRGANLHFLDWIYWYITGEQPP